MPATPRVPSGRGRARPSTPPARSPGPADRPDRRDGALLVTALRRATGALVDLVLPSLCAGCGRLGSPWCRDCARALAHTGVPSEAMQPGRQARARYVRPERCPRGMPATWAARGYDGVLAGAVVAYKDQGRRDLRGVLAPLLAESILAACRHLRDVGPPGESPRLVRVVPVPSSSAAVRRRGDRPVDLLGRAALEAPAVVACREDLVWSPWLRVVRRVADQARLSRNARADNLAHAFAVPDRMPSGSSGGSSGGSSRTSRRVSSLTSAELRGACVIVVDDVMTTGATLTEAARALRAAGAGRVVAATVAATPRQADSPECRPARPRFD